MADQDYLKKIAALVRGPNEVRYPLPLSTEGARLSHLFQVECFKAFATRKDNGVDIVLGLHSCERDKATDPVKGLDETFAEYANDSRYSSERMGLIKFIHEDGSAWWPDRFALHPTFGADDIVSEKAGKSRWEQIERKRDRDPRLLVLSWRLISEALESGKLVSQMDVGPRANMYQVSTDADGRMVLWVATLPQLTNHQRPNKERYIKLFPNQRGLLVQLTAPFLANLVYLLNDTGAADDGIAFAKAYYVGARRETVVTLTKCIEEHEAELAEMRKRLSELTSSEPVSAK